MVSLYLEIVVSPTTHNEKQRVSSESAQSINLNHEYCVDRPRRRRAAELNVQRGGMKVGETDDSS